MCICVDIHVCVYVCTSMYIYLFKWNISVYPYRNMFIYFLPKLFHTNTSYFLFHGRPESFNHLNKYLHITFIDQELFHYEANTFIYGAIYVQIFLSLAK